MSAASTHHAGVDHTVVYETEVPPPRVHDEYGHDIPVMPPMPSHAAPDVPHSSRQAADEVAVEMGTAVPVGGHPHVVCDCCGKAIVGVRYKCGNCVNYDLCAECEARNVDGSMHLASHVFLKLRRPLHDGGPYHDALLPMMLYIK